MTTNAALANPHDNRLGFRINEWTSLTGTSRPTIWRQIKDGRLKIVNVNGIKLIPRSEAVRLGLLDDHAPDAPL
jgi:predicted DNA-binding transcriptional regulator AlpA